MKRWALFFLLAAFLGMALALYPTVGSAQTSSDEQDYEEYNEETIKAIDKGIGFLASTQKKETGAWEQGVTMVATSQASLALMAHGSTPGRGTYGKQVEKAVEFVISTQRNDGYLTYKGSRMYEHGFCSLFLAEAFGMCHSEALNKKLRTTLQKAIELIVRTQGDKGGWWYEPSKGDTDISVTICQTMALRAARTCGIKIPLETIKKVTQGIKEAACPDGGFAYRLPNSGGSAPPRSAAGVCILQALGKYNKDKETINGIKYLEKLEPSSATSWFFYFNYYAAHAMYQAGGEYWKKWWPKVRDTLVRSQLSNGSWQDKDSGGNIYSTGMALIILQIPYRYLPIVTK